MHNNRGRKTVRKYQQPRRTHNLGGCSTCRLRHVKCDQTRPHCSVCRNANLQCGGFPSQIRWASMSTGPNAPKSAQALQKMPAAQPTSTPQSTTAQQNAALTQPSSLRSNGGNSSNTLQQDDDAPRPSIPAPPSLPTANLPISFHDTSPTSAEIPSHAPACLPFMLPMGDVSYLQDDVRYGTNEHGLVNYPTTSSFSEIDSLLDNSTGVGWSDLFDPSMSLAMPTIHNHIYHDPLSLLVHVASQPHEPNDGSLYLDELFKPSDFPDQQTMETTLAVPSSQPPPYAPKEVDDAEILENAKVLLKHFRDNIIAQFAPLPMHSKSPWEVLNWSNAVHTLADMTFLQNPNVKHANIANLFGILGCAAHTIAKTQSCPDTLSSRKAAQILDYASRQAKSHLQESLRSETDGPQKAKYKDQLMAIFSLIALATISGNSADARCYIIDAERLLRLRGLAKREVSRRARLLHHVYTWLRIVGESTFVLHHHDSSGLQAKIETMIRNNKAVPSGLPAPEQDAVPASEQFQFDDFLRIETHSTDSDSDIDSSKDQEAGLRDIHLADLRQWSNTLYIQIYGIPEAWLSLVSQTTRVANIIDFLERTPSRAPRAFTDSLQRKTTQLEHMPGNAESNWLSIGGVLYRRIRNVHPFILQSHITDIITALGDYDLAQNVAKTKSPGTPWPAFIAGCEALSPSAREWLMDWLKRGEERSIFSGFTSAQQIMRKVWEQRDAARMAQRSDSGIAKEAIIHSWVDILREGKIWLMLY
ncbi:fungal-specific transcription factor domain-containing protein [Phaeosphaeria sp. MPI-PUGE-AT-0046c]|nr:fungal-specific transcription factor domain-containing protein [Phaeosphaeria sp. MPI-PUGE-AT-0046c]